MTIGTVSTGIARATETALTAQSNKQSAKATMQLGQYNAALLENEANQLQEASRKNIIRMRKNAREELNVAELDAAKNNIMRTGSVIEREMTLATKLESAIQDQAYQSLQQVNSLRNQAAKQKWEAQLQAQQLKQNAKRSLFSGLTQSVSSFFK